jgi:hypothetical protein
MFTGVFEDPKRKKAVNIEKSSSLLFDIDNTGRRGLGSSPTFMVGFSKLHSWDGPEVYVLPRHSTCAKAP